MLISFMRLFFLFLLPLSLFAKDLQKPLPNWIDLSREQKVLEDTNFQKTIWSPYSEWTLQNPPPADFHIPAEYEPLRAVVLGWGGYSSILKSIAVAVTNDGDAEVWAAEGPSASSIAGVLASKYQPINCNIDTVWIRDYGPFGVLSDHSLALVDTRYRHYQYRVQDDALPICLGEAKQIPTYTTDLILDGGNLMVDSVGNLFMTKRTYNWNSGRTVEQVNKILRDYFNVKEIHVFDYAGYPSSPADGTGHIDMYVKLLSDSTVMIAESSSEPFKTATNKAVDYFSKLTAPSGGAYKIVRVPGYKGGSTWYTYTNSLIVNNIVMVPSYNGYPEGNKEAKRVYQEAYPDKKIVMIPSDESITSGGSIHCVTQQVPR